MFPSTARNTDKKQTEVQLISKRDAEAEIQKLKRYVADLEQKEKDKKRSSNVLVPCSPSPRKKKRVIIDTEPTAKDSSAAQPTQIPISGGAGPALSARHYSENPTARPKSTLLDGLKTIRTNLKTKAIVRTAPRNTSFLDPRPEPPSTNPPTQPQPSPFCSRRIKSGGAPECATLESIQANEERLEPQVDSRASDLTIRTEIPVGPIQFRHPLGDPDFNTLEPNSNVRLKRRMLSHADLQEHLYGRHIVRINELYSIIRKLDNGKPKGGTEWDVPLVGDWVLFAVVGEKGDFKLTNPQVDYKPVNQPNNGKDKNLTGNEAEDLDVSLQRDERSQQACIEAEFTTAHRARQRKHYVNLKLIDLSSKTVSQSGSGMVKMLLFEAQEEILTDTVDVNGMYATEKAYRGGSGGAYEKFYKEQPGTLLAILNPKVMKSRPLPNRGTGTLDVLCITPEKAASVMVIGRAKDLGNCTAKRFDTGQICGNWCDLRTSGGAEDDEDVSKSLSVCEFHLQRQISKTRAGRAEFFVSTSGMNTQVCTTFSLAAVRKNGKSKEYDPVKKTGLLPATGSKGTRVVNGEVTYICPGIRPNPNIMRKGVIKKDRWDEPLDAERLDAIRRRRARERADKELKTLLNHEGSEKTPSLGGQYLLDAQRLLNAKQKKAGEATPEASNSRNAPSKPRKTFDDTLVRAIGHDPTSASTQASSSALQCTSVEDRSSMFLDLLGEDEPVRKLGPDTLRSVDVKHGARSSVGGKKSTKVVSVELGMKEQEEGESGGSDSDDSLIVLPPS